MKNKKHTFFTTEKGFTLVELLIALAITTVIGSAIAMTMSQLFSVSIADTNRMDAVKQVENALHYINRDAQMASVFQSQIPTGTQSLPLDLKWTNYVDDLDYDVVYSLNGNDFERIQTTNTRPPTVPTVTTNRVASNIESTSTYLFDGDTLTINLTSTVTGYRSATESRTLQVKPRVN